MSTPNTARSRGKRTGVVAVVSVLAVLFYVLAIALFSESGRNEIYGPVPTETTDGVSLQMEIVSIDPARNLVTFRIVIFPTGSYTDDGGLTFAKPVRVTLWGQTSGAIARIIPVGEVVGARESITYVNGDISTYPLDQYSFRIPAEDLDEAARLFPKVPAGAAPFLTVEAVDAAGKASVDPDAPPVPLGVLADWQPDRLQGWSQQWSVAVADSTMYLDVTLTRGGGVLAFVFVALGLMVALAVVAIIVAIKVSTRKRRIEATMASWFGAMLFALIPLRNFLPGAPPIGAWLDVLVFFWIVVALMVSMCFFVGSWVRFSAPPKIAPKEDGHYNLP